MRQLARGQADRSTDVDDRIVGCDTIVKGNACGNHLTAFIHINHVAFRFCVNQGDILKLQHAPFFNVKFCVDHDVCRRLTGSMNFKRATLNAID